LVEKFSHNFQKKDKMAVIHLKTRHCVIKNLFKALGIFFEATNINTKNIKRYEL